MTKFATILVSGLLVFITASHADIERVSVSSTGEQGNNQSFGTSLSADGRFIVFTSTASNFVPGDSVNSRDIFVHDRDSGNTERLNLVIDSEQINYNTNTYVSINADGRYVTFHGYTGLFNYDDFIHDRQLGVTERVSVSSSGERSVNSTSISPSVSSVSADGRFVAFTSNAANLVADDSNDTFDVFVRDRISGTTERVSVSSTNAQGNGLSRLPSISDDGRFVVFISSADNLVEADTNAANDIFIRDRALNSTQRLSISSLGVQANSSSGYPSITRDGRYVVFYSKATNLVEGDINAMIDIFIHDRDIGTTELVSVSSNGEQGDSISINPAVSSDGRFVVFHSSASNLVEGDTAGNMTYPNYTDVFVHDRNSGITERLSVSSSGVQGNNNSAVFFAGANGPSISADGRFVGFESSARNLVAADTNGEDDIFVTENNLSLIGDDLSVTLEPTSGAVEVGTYIRFRARFKNNSSSTLFNCNARIINPLVNGRREFSYYSWPLNVANPVLNGSIDVAPGERGQMNLAILPRVAVRDEVSFEYKCDSTQAYTIPYINTVHLTAKTSPLISEDFVRLRNGSNKTAVVIDRSNGKYWSPFVIEVGNTGDSPTSVNLTTTSNLATSILRKSSLCEPLDPANGNWSCSMPRDTQLQVELGADETKKLLVFVHAKTAIAKKPIANRINVEASDSAGEVVAKTSMGISTVN